MDTKSLSFKQLYLVQKLFIYYYQIDYCQAKANKATDILSHFL